MKIALLGYGDEGKAAYEYWNTPENTLTICDQQEPADLPKGADTRIGPDYLKDLEVFDLLVRTPGLYPPDILAANPDHPEIMGRVTSVTNEFFQACPSKNIIGITGTKGKGTTSSLIAKILEAAGHKVHLGGNIGIPALTMLKDTIKPSDWVVLELSNFQLIDINYSPKVAVCLMIMPEHLNWHIDTYEYVHAKERLFIHQSREDLAVYNARSLFSQEIATASPATKLAYDVPPQENEEPLVTTGVYVRGEHIYANDHVVCKTSDVMLLGRHNLENVCAAVAATWDIIKHDKAAVKAALQSFAGLPHRLEIVRHYKDVWYTDDSFGTTPETAIVAIKAFEQPKVLILGGSDKGSTYDELAQTVVSSDIRHIIAIGQMGPQIMAAIDAQAPAQTIPRTILDETTTMPTIVKTAAKVAQKDDVVLLSTACASFDMFTNYKDRGEQFKKAVKALA